MPILWRFLLTQYLKVLGLAAGSIIAVLMVTRLDEVAEFAILGAQSKAVLLYTWYQVPYILPVALPIACVLSAMILYQRLSSTREITAMRASGIAMRAVIAPVLVASLYLALLDFWVISDFTTSCRLRARQMELDLRTVNPVGLLKHRRLLKFTDAFGDIMGEFNGEDAATDVILAMHNHKNSRTDLAVVKAVQGTSQEVTADFATMIHSMPSPRFDDFDHLVVENVENSVTPVSILSREMRKEGWKLSRDHLDTALLLVRIKQDTLELTQAKALGASQQVINYLKRRLQNAYSELARRFSLAFAVFTFTLLGTAYGVTISRIPSRKNVIVVASLVALFLVAFFMAKAKEERFFLAFSLYTIPHILLLGCSIRILSRASKGIECA